MRVALVDPSLFTLPYDAALSGALGKAGCDVTLYGRPARPTDTIVDGVNLDRRFYGLSERRWARSLPAPVRLLVRGIDHIAGMQSLLRRLRETRPDVIHFEWLPLPAVDRYLLARFRKIAPMVLTIHDSDPFNGNPAARLQSLGNDEAIRRFDRLIVHTRQGERRMIAAGFAPGLVDVIPHGRFSSTAEKTPVQLEDIMTFLLFGKLKPYKGADILLHAFSALPPALREQARLRIIGEAFMDLAPLHKLAAALGITTYVSIEATHVPDKEIDGLFSPDTVAIFPYREIEASGVLYHALANGRPIVASRLGAFADLLQDGVHGRLVAPGDISALSAAMAELITDRPAARRYAAAVAHAQDSVPPWEEIGRRTLGVYADAIAQVRMPRQATAMVAEQAA